MTTTTTRRPRKTEAERQAHYQEALDRARNGSSLNNEALTVQHFAALGYDDIRPRENVLTFKAWQALGRVVKKGEHGCRLTTWTTTEKEDPKTGKAKTTSIPRPSYVFHEDQTKPLD
jgi:antirestriction protein ArdC